MSRQKRQGNRLLLWKGAVPGGYGIEARAAVRRARTSDASGQRREPRNPAPCRREACQAPLPCGRRGGSANDQSDRQRLCFAKRVKLLVNGTSALAGNQSALRVSTG